MHHVDYYFPWILLIMSEKTMHANRFARIQAGTKLLFSGIIGKAFGTYLDFKSLFP
jgi:hypothetical protein